MTGSNMPISYDDETLVAYLDGELSSQETAAIHAALQHDQSLKDRIQRLRKTWELLSELPEDEPNPQLAQSTIEMIVLDVSQEKVSWIKRLARNRWAVLGLVGLLAFAGGVALGKLRSYRQQQDFLRNVTLLVHYDDLALIDSEEWLVKLAQIEELVQAAGQANNMSRPSLEVPATNAQRLQWLQQLDSGARANLAKHQPALQRAPPERSAELNKIVDRMSQKLDAQSDLDYEQLLSAYAAILDQVGTVERTNLNAIEDLDQRAAEVAKLVRREMAFAYAEKLSFQDRAAFRNWNGNLQDRLWEVFSRLPDPDAKVVNEIYRPPEESLVSEEDLQELQQALSPAAKQLLAGLDVRLRRDVLGVWLFYMFEPTSAASPNNAEDLRRRFEQLSNEEKSKLEFLSEFDVRQQLSL